MGLREEELPELELLPGYRVDETAFGALVTLPWPDDPEEKWALAQNSLGPTVIDWAEGRTDEPGLTHYLTGADWRFTPGQKRFLIMWYAYDPATGRYLYRSGVKRGAKGPIAHDTPVMTPSGWTTHGELQVGSEVYASNGEVTRVTDLLPEVLEPTYRVRFSGGAEVVCTGSHRWPVEVPVGRGPRRRVIKTVDEMLEEGLSVHRPLTTGKTKAARGDFSRFRTLVSPAVEGTPADFGVDPYLFGYWLGNGDKDGPRFTADDRDMPFLVSELDRLGVAHGKPRTTHGHAQRIGFGNQGRSKAWLREIGVLNDKRIPQRLLRASLSQRWSMLQGLVDSDGHVTKRDGQVQISLSKPDLADDVRELAVSLGLMPRVTSRPYRLPDGRERLSTSINFTPQPGEPAARLPRKVARLKTVSRHKVPFSRARMIESIEPVATTPARCITVAHHSHEYLVGEWNVPTCNTGKDPFAAAHMNIEFLGPSQLIRDPDSPTGWSGMRHRMPLVQIASNSEAQSKDTLRIANAMLGEDARRYYRIDAGETMTKLKDGTGGRMEVLTYSERSSEGDPATFIVLNESHHMKGDGGYAIAAVARRNVGKSPAELQARVVEYTNAHQLGTESVAGDSFDAWQKQISGFYPGLKRDILYDSVEADPRLRTYVDWELELGIRQAYSDAAWADHERLRDEALDPRTTPGDSIRFYFNGLAAAEDAWVDPQKFDALADPSLVLHDGDAITLFLDCSKSEDATGLVASRLYDGAIFVLGFWQRPHGARGKDWLAPREEVDATLRDAFERYRIIWCGIDPSPARDDEDESLYWKPMIDGIHRDYHKRVKMWATPGAVRGHSVLFDMRMSTNGARERNQRFTEMAGVISENVDEYEGLGKPPLIYQPHAALRMHVHAAKRRPNQWGFSLGKASRDSNKLVDLAVCMVGARLGRETALNAGVKAGRRPGQPTQGRVSGGRAAGGRPSNGRGR